MCASYSRLYEEGEGGISQRPSHETFSGFPIPAVWNFDFLSVLFCYMMMMIVIIGI